MEECLYYYFLHILDMIMIYMGFSLIFKEKRIKNIILIVLSILFFADLKGFVSNLWVINSWLADMAVAVVTFLFIRLHFKANKILLFIYFLLIMLCENLIIIGVGIIFDLIGEKFTSNIVVMTLGVQILIAISYYILGRKSKSKITSLNQKSLMILLKTLIIPVLILSFLYELYFVKEDNFWFLLTILLYIISLFILFNNTIHLITLTEKETKTKMLEYTLKQSEEQINNLNDYYKGMRKIKHDMKNNLLIMNSLLMQEKYEEVSNYMKKLIEKLEVTSKVYKTGNVYLDAILNSKVAENPDIKINYKGIVSGEIFISEIDLCTLLFNLLDNAINELRQHEELKKEICLNVSQEETQMIINVSNPLSKKKDIDKGSKTLDHGLGLVIAREIVDKYDGYLYIKQDEEFSVTIQLFGD